MRLKKIRVIRDKAICLEILLKGYAGRGIIEIQNEISWWDVQLE